MKSDAKVLGEAIQRADARIATLETALEMVNGDKDRLLLKAGKLEAALAEERARGAVEGLPTLWRYRPAEPMCPADEEWTYSESEPEDHYYFPTNADVLAGQLGERLAREVEAYVKKISDPSPAVAALLELAEAAVRRRKAELVAWRIERGEEPGDYDVAECARADAECAEDAAVDRWREVKGNG